MAVPKQANKKLSASKPDASRGVWKLLKYVWLIAVVLCLFSLSRLHSPALSGVGTVQKVQEEASPGPGLNAKDMSGDATVMGMASGYGLDTYQQFVGSLRNTGYKGHIILGIAPDAPQGVLDYLAARQVTAKVMTWVNCTYADPANKKDIFQKTTCAHPYPDIKLRWSRFPLAKDWLMECPECTGPVLITDVRDVIFQENPFGRGAPEVKGLHLFEEHRNQTTMHWLVSYYVKACKNVMFEKPMLCSGTTIGTRDAMIKYLEVMYAEMKVWINDEKCRFDRNGDDQTIHNYLFYATERLRAIATAVPHRRGIVNTVGVEGAVLWKRHLEEGLAHNLTNGQVQNTPYWGASGSNWIGPQFGLTDGEGYLTNLDGTRSRVIHQFDRLSFPYTRLWLSKQPFMQDPFP